LGCFCQEGKAKHPKWNQVPLPFAKWIIVVQAKTALCAGREVKGCAFEGMSRWAPWGHGGAKRTTTFLKKSYYWPNLKEDAKEYVKTCFTCQQNRVVNKKQAGLLRPLPILERPWESVSMDFMVSLPPSRGFDAIMVVVDRFSKMAHFIPTKKSATAQETGRLFFTHVFKHHGLPNDIVSDRDPKFTSKFWRALWKRMGTELKMNTSFRPQMDG